MFYSDSDRENFPSPIMALVVQPITGTKEGRVQCMASSWPARFDGQVSSDQELPIGSEVMVWAREGITLLIQVV